MGYDKAIFRKEKKKAERRYEENFNKWREYELLTAIIALVSLSLSMVDWEYARLTTKSIVNDPDNYKTLCGDKELSNSEC